MTHQDTLSISNLSSQNGQQETSLREYYVYTLDDSRTREVFYVGKGVDERMHDHLRAAIAHPEKFISHASSKCAEIVSQGGDVISTKVYSTFDELDAYEKEIELITLIGHENLVNRAPGGLWTGFSSLKSKSLKGRNLSQAHKDSISATLKGRKLSEETKRKLSESKKGIKYDDARRKQISDQQRGDKHWTKRRPKATGGSESDLSNGSTSS